MKTRDSIKIIYALLALWLIAVALLTLTACGKGRLCEVCGKPARDHMCCPPAPCPVCGEVGSCDCAETETSLTQEPCPVCGATYICDCVRGIVIQTQDPPCPTCGSEYACNCIK